MEKVVVIENWKNQTFFKDVEWICKAMSNDDSRSWNGCIFIDRDGKFISTDGHRAHVAYLELPADMTPAPGSYRVIKGKGNITLKRDDDVTMPEILQCFPQLEKDDVYFDLHIPEKKSGGYSPSYAKLIRAMPENTVNLKYFEDLADEYWQVKIGDGKDPLRFMNHTKEAVIMPMRA